MMNKDLKVAVMFDLLLFSIQLRYFNWKTVENCWAITPLSEVHIVILLFLENSL